MLTSQQYETFHVADVRLEVLQLHTARVIKS